MASDFSEALRRAGKAMRASDLSGATRIIQEALAGHGGDAAGPAARGTGTTGLKARPTAAGKGAPKPRPLGSRLREWMQRGAEEAQVVTEAKARPRPAASPVPPVSPKPVMPSMPKILETLAAHLPKGVLDGQGLGGLKVPTPGAEMPAGAQFLSRSHAGPAGARNYRLYIPACGAAKVKGLVIMLHGCNQNPDDFARGTGMNAVAETERLAVAYPEQTGASHAQSCWNWYEPGHQSPDRGEPAILAGIVRDLSAEFRLPPSRVYLAGLSAGGAMAAILADTHPELFGALGVHSGLPAGAARDVGSAFAAMGGRGTAGRPASGAGAPRLIVFHGDADKTVNIANAARLLDGVGAEGRRETGQVPQGHAYTRTVYPGANGVSRAESWVIAGAGHAWAGGNAAGSFTDPTGPNASREMVRFFLEGK